MIRHAVFVSLVVCWTSATGCASGERAPHSAILPSDAQHNEKALLRILWPALQNAKDAGRIYFRSTCPAKSGYPIPFPSIKIKSPHTEKEGLDGVRAALEGSADVTLPDRKPGVVRIEIGRVPRSLLRVNISELRFSPLAQYNAALAIGAIESSEEVQFAARAADIHLLSLPYNMLVVEPGFGRPHLPSKLTNVTVDQALDAVAQTFGGIVEYAYCASPATVDVKFTGGNYFDSRWLYN